MTDLSTLIFFRAIVQAVPKDQMPVLYLVQVADGYILENFLGSRLKTSRGSLRVFSSADTALRCITDDIAKPAGRAIEVRFIAAGAPDDHSPS